MFIVIPGPALRADLGVDLVIEVVLHVPDLVLEIALEAVPDLETNLKIDHLISHLIDHLKNHKMRNVVLILQMNVAEVHLLVKIVQEVLKKKKNVPEVVPLQLLLVMMIVPGEKRK